jgi:16S rRNA (adenine1518-N6/adenine1519-N6)-dimethyltransferase
MKVPESPRAIRAVLAEIGLRPSRRRGQNFLSDANLRDAIVRSAGVSPGDLVLEVGPGLGVLTKGLLEAGAEVVAVEQDAKLADFLTGALAGEERLTVLCRDILEKKEIAAEVRDRLDRPWLAVSNLPYSVASPFTASLFRHPEPPRQALLMVQKEAAERMTGRPGTADYGPLAVLLALAADVRIDREVAPRVFVPAPKVQSAIVRLAPRPISREDLLAAEIVSRAAFLHRRKSIRKSLVTTGYDAGAVADALAEVAVDPGDRPGTLRPELYVALGKILGKAKKS